MDIFITGILLSAGMLLGAGTLCGFIIVALIWKAITYAISELPYCRYKIKEWLK